ncbi:MAG: helix-turn-helix transcriptional regulator [Burkholderiaceae bacterium]|jgi:molybdate transport repressor ModE-like protein|nr:helix-turn-helix transcriptional regulator [Burkholderiaceae bacterium]
MYHVSIETHWRIGTRGGPVMDTTSLLHLLTLIHTSGSILQAAKVVGMSYRHAWNRLHEAETVFGAPLIQKKRGKGATLTRLGNTLLWADRRITARLEPTLESLSSELEGELSRSTSDTTAPLRLYASYGFAVAALMERINQTALPVELRYLNSMESIAALSQKECELAGFHVPVGHFEAETLRLFLPYLHPQELRFIHFANLNQGLLVTRDNPKKIRKIRDLTRKGVRFVNRQVGSGTRRILEWLLKRDHISSAHINGFETAEFTHAAVAAYIASNMADVGFGVETAARQFGLDFVPVMQERYLFAVRRDVMEKPTMDRFLAILRSEEFRQHVNQLGGYDATHTGRIMRLHEAFGNVTEALPACT